MSEPPRDPLLAKGYGTRHSRSLARLRTRPWAIHPGAELFRPTPGPHVDREGVRRCAGVLPCPFHDAREGEFEKKDRKPRETWRGRGMRNVAPVYLGGSGENPSLAATPFPIGGCGDPLRGKDPGHVFARR